MDLKKNSGKRLRECRQILLGESAEQKDFAVFLSTEANAVSKQNISDWETGKSSIPLNIQSVLANKGISLTWLVNGEGSVYADNEAGKRLAVKAVMNRNGTPSWNEYHTPAARLGKVVELLGGFMQAEVILNIPRHELQTALTAGELSTSVLKPCRAIGFAMDWLVIGLGAFYDTSVEGMALATAFETGKISEWASSLFDKAMLNQNVGFKPRTVGERMGLARILLCEFHGIKDAAVNFAKFLSEHPSNVEKRVFRAKEVEEWEANIIAANDALPLVVEEGINLLWLMTGEEEQGRFNKTQAGKRLSKWYAARKQARPALETV